MSGELTSKEAEVYDRQIRLWGVEGQKRLQAAHVCVIGLGALGVEVSKNLILAGVQTTVIDDEPVSLEAVGTQFFLRDADVGLPVRRDQPSAGWHVVVCWGGGSWGSPWCSSVHFVLAGSCVQRSTACLKPLRDLNPLVAVHQRDGTVTSLAAHDSGIWAAYRCVIVTAGTPSQQASTRAVLFCPGVGER